MTKEEYQDLINTLNWWTKIAEIVKAFAITKNEKQTVKQITQLQLFVNNIINQNEQPNNHDDNNDNHSVSNDINAEWGQRKK